MWKKLFCKKIDNIAAAAFLVATSSLLSRLLGVVRDHILAGKFGAGDTLDVYYAAFRVPDFIFNLIVLGALSAGFVPLFTSLIKTDRAEDHQQAWRLASGILNTLLLVVAILGLAGEIFAPQLMRLITPGFSGAKMDQVISLARIMFLSPILLCVSSIFGGILQSYKRFVAYSLPPIFYNLGIIFGALYLTNRWGVWGLAWGVVIGSACHLLIQLPAVISLKFNYQFVFGWRDKLMKKIWIMMSGRTLDLLTTQLNLLVTTIMASTLVSGSLAIFSLANNLQAFAVSLFGISFAVAVFPTLAAQADDYPELKKTFTKTLRQVWFFILPATALTLVLRAQLVRFVLGSGNFGWNETILTFNTLGLFCLSFFAQAAIPLLSRMFFAQHDTKTPFLIGLFGDGLNIILAIVLARSMGVVGLALAFSLANVFNFATMTIFLRRRLGKLSDGKLIKAALKFTVAAVIGGLVAQAAKQPFGDPQAMTHVSGVFLQGAVAGITGVLVYVLVCYLLRVEEVGQMWTAVACRLGRRKTALNEDMGEVRGI